ncbi:DUF6665 family protein [Hoeflea olei]|nr:DUF6665 family protein [Hoeflea olei]
MPGKESFSERRFFSLRQRLCDTQALRKAAQLVRLAPLTQRPAGATSWNMDISDRLRLTLRQGNDPIDAFAYEARQEAASALGRIGRQLEEALAALKRHDETPNSNRDREDLLQDAADRVQALIIQREAFGLYASRDIQNFYGVPREVMLRIGIVRLKR